MTRTALVTGASRGIGRAVATELSREGYRVISAVRVSAQAPPLPDSAVEVLDVGSRESIESLARRLSARGEGLNVLVNNAGIYRGAARAIWDVNVRGPLLLTRSLAPLLVDGARVVMVTSGLGRSSGQAPKLLARLRGARTLGDLEKLCDEAPGDYGASKAALNRLTQLFAAELEGRRIRVNAVSPGWARTDMGGAGAPRSVEQGAASILWGCRLGPDGPSGGFFEDGRPVE